MTINQLKQKLNQIIFEIDTPAGKNFDLCLLWAIIISTVIVLLESVKHYQFTYGQVLKTFEIIFTIIFTIEYFLRIFSSKTPSKYIFSFFGLIDLCSTIPTYLSYFFIGTHSFLVLRTFRLLRIFRILKLARFIDGAKTLKLALNASKHKILVFLWTIFTLVIILGTFMYLIEGESNGFTSIPKSIYWAIVTLTTVGYGDITPNTILGQILSSIIMILGYGIIAVPTGIVSVEYSNFHKIINNTKICSSCNTTDHYNDAVFCRLCATELLIK